MSAVQEASFQRVDRWGRARQYENRGRPMNEEKISTLGLWVKSSGLSRKEVAEKLGISLSYVHLLCRGERRPDIDLAFKIEELTGIDAKSWVKPQ
jgi:DNA-binding XRE family transcriptional regulator